MEVFSTFGLKESRIHAPVSIILFNFPFLEFSFDLFGAFRVFFWGAFFPWPLVYIAENGYFVFVMKPKLEPGQKIDSSFTESD